MVLIFLVVCMSLGAMDNNSINQKKSTYYQIDLSLKTPFPGSLMETFKMGAEERLNVVSQFKFEHPHQREEYIDAVLDGIVYIPEKKLLFIKEAERAFIMAYVMNLSDTSDQEVISQPLAKLSDLGEVTRRRSWSK